MLRKCDERFKDQGKYKQGPDPLYDKTPKKPNASTGKLTPQDFYYDKATNSLICPAGKALYGNGSQCTTHGKTHHKFTGARRDWGPCHLRDQCLRTPDKTPVRQVAIFHPNQPSTRAHTEAMRRRIDSPEGRMQYGRRIVTVEPVFGNLRYNKRLDRFTLRGQSKVDTQWKLYCMVHNIGKLAHHGYAQ